MSTAMAWGGVVLAVGVGFVLTARLAIDGLIWLMGTGDD